MDLASKRLELVHKLVPNMMMVALLVNPGNPNTPTVSAGVEQMAMTLGLQTHALQAETDEQLDRAFDNLTQLPTPGLVIGNDPFFNSRSEKLAQLTQRVSIPAVYQYRKFVEAGGLMSYGASNIASHHQLVVYAGRILAGAKPADLPVKRSTKIDLLLNANTAKALSLVIPASLIARADEIGAGEARSCVSS